MVLYCLSLAGLFLFVYLFVFNHVAYLKVKETHLFVQYQVTREY